MLNSCLLTIFQQREWGGVLPPLDVLNSCLLKYISQRERWGAASLGRVKLVSVNLISAEGVGW